MDSLITRAFTGGQSLANLDICGYSIAEVNQSVSFPSSAKYGCIIAVGGIVTNFPIWFKRGITGAISLGTTGTTQIKVAGVQIEASSVRATGQDITVVWYG